MATLRIDPYKPASRGAKSLSRYSGILRATARQIQLHGSFTHIINWGNSERRFEHANYTNIPEAVAVASDKLRSCRELRTGGIATAAFTTDCERAIGWLADDIPVLARQYLRASGGRGITYYEPGQYRRSDNGSETASTTDSAERAGNGRGAARAGVAGRRIVEAPLYTKYIKKANEYRIHVFDGVVIDIQQKRKRQEIPNEEINYQIRNHTNGWVYCHDNVQCPSIAVDNAIRAVAVLGLDFGAVDVGYNDNNEAACVYEVNTAPGLEGTTLEKYREALERRFPQIARGAYARRRTYGGGGAY